MGMVIEYRDVAPEVYVGLYMLYTLIALVAVWDTAREYIEDRKDYRYSQKVGNGRSIMGRGRFRVATWMSLGLFALFVRALAGDWNLIRNGVPDNLPTATWLLIFTNVVVFCFWRARKSERNTRREALDHRREIEQAAIHAAEKVAHERIREQIAPVVEVAEKLEEQQREDLEISREIRDEIRGERKEEE